MSNRGVTETAMLLDQFTTARLSVHSWTRFINDKAMRQSLEAALSTILSRRVLVHLPPSLHLDDGEGAVSSWIDARAKESEVLLVEWKSSGALVGLMILATGPEDERTPTVHIGYLLAEEAWGRGIASELVKGFVSAAEIGGPVRLVGGVDKDNPASARALRKAGFRIAPELSTQELEMYVRMIG